MRHTSRIYFRFPNGIDFIKIFSLFIGTRLSHESVIASAQLLDGSRLNSLLIALDCIYSRSAAEKPLFSEPIARDNYTEIITTFNPFLYQLKCIYSRGVLNRSYEYLDCGTGMSPHNVANLSPSGRSIRLHTVRPGVIRNVGGFQREILWSLARTRSRTFWPF